MPVRKIIRIDEEKCNGCGLCVAACAEGAIAVIDGKARLVNETYCDGLGACLGECPQGAITVEEREAAPFDEEAVTQAKAAAVRAEPLPCGCPGAHVQALAPDLSAHEPTAEPREERPSRLRNWPVQLRLVPLGAPYLRGADLVIAADCVPFAFAGFHERFLPGRVLLVGCPKLDDASAYRAKLAALFRQNEIRSVEVAYMEVPCCGSLVRLVRDAVFDAGGVFAVKATRIGIDGRVQETRALERDPSCCGHS